MIVAALTVGHKAIRAILNAIFGIGAVAAAILAQGIQRTIAEQAVKILGFSGLMTGKILTFLILKKFIMFHISTPSMDKFPVVLR
jgi:urea transporter